MLRLNVNGFRSTVAVLTMLVMQSGCNALYLKGEPDPDHGGCERETTLNGACRFVQTNPLHASQSWLVVSRKRTETMGGTSGLLFGLTPLALVAPLFGYPYKEDSYTGTLKLQLGSSNPAPKIYSFETKPGVPTRLVVNFNENVPDELRRDGRATKYSPDRVAFTIKCKSDSCSVSPTPNIVDASGNVSLKYEIVEDVDRIKELAEEKRRSVAAQKAAEDLVQSRRAQEEFAKANHKRQLVDGYKSTKWGMTPAEVKEAIRSDDKGWQAGELEQAEGYRFIKFTSDEKTLTCIFFKDMLTQVKYEPLAADGDEKGVGVVLGVLKEKYGVGRAERIGAKVTKRLPIARVVWDHGATEIEFRIADAEALDRYQDAIGHAHLLYPSSTAEVLYTSKNLVRQLENDQKQREHKKDDDELKEKAKQIGRDL